MRLISYRSLEHHDILRISAMGDFSVEDLRRTFKFFFEEPMATFGVIFDLRDGLTAMEPEEVTALGKFIHGLGGRRAVFGIISFPDVLEMVQKRYDTFPGLVADHVALQVKVFTRESEAYAWANGEMEKTALSA